jgi:hypothetical protein
LAVASEPGIFWRGDGAAFIIEQIRIPGVLGRLVPADGRFNGPSGIALDEYILSPLVDKRWPRRKSSWNGEEWFCNT